MSRLADNSVALVVTSPPYFVGKDYETALAADPGALPSSYADYLRMLEAVVKECKRVLEPGGRVAINVANLGRKPYRSLASDVSGVLEGAGLLARGEVVWRKGDSLSGSCAWGSFRSPANPVLRDTTERVVIASKGRFDRAKSRAERARNGLPSKATITTDEFLAATTDVWDIPAESATRVGHPAPFPVELPRRLIELYTYEGDLVLDPFAGSGATLVAARRAGRRAVGYDLDPDYVERARSRLAEPLSDFDAADDERFAKAAAAGKGVGDIARDRLALAGFDVDTTSQWLRGTGLSFDARASTPDGREFLVVVLGGFTVVTPGLRRGDQIQRLALFSQLAAGMDAQLLVLTPALPRPRTPLAKMVAEMTSDQVAGVFELFDRGDEARLQDLARRP